MTPAAKHLLLTLIAVTLLAGCAGDTEPAMDIWTASAEGNIEVIRQHIEYGTDLDAGEPLGGSTPLILAALFGQTGAARLLVENGASLDSTNNDGSTALHTAAFFCFPETVAYLIEQGARLDIRNHFGSTPLEAVSGAWTPELEEIYTMFGNLLQVELDLERIRSSRPQVAELIRQHVQQQDQ